MYYSMHNSDFLTFFFNLCLYLFLHIYLLLFLSFSFYLSFRREFLLFLGSFFVLGPLHRERKEREKIITFLVIKSPIIPKFSNIKIPLELTHGNFNLQSTRSNKWLRNDLLFRVVLCIALLKSVLVLHQSWNCYANLFVLSIPLFSSTCRWQW